MSGLTHLILRMMRVTLAGVALFLFVFIVYFLIKKYNIEGALWPLNRQEYGTLGLISAMLVFSIWMWVSVGRELRKSGT